MANHTGVPGAGPGARTPEMLYFMIENQRVLLKDANEHKQQKICQKETQKDPKETKKQLPERQTQLTNKNRYNRHLKN